MLAALAAAATPAAFGQTRVSIAEMEQKLAMLAQQEEADTAAQLAEYQLTERVSPARLDRWQSQFKGTFTRQSLLYMADASSVDILPASERPAAPPPAESEKAAILQRAREYVQTMRPRLPNFSAVRSMISFEVSTLDQIKAEERELQFIQLSNKKLGFHSLGMVDAIRQLFLAGSSDQLVTYRDGSEVQSPAESQSGHLRLAPRGLTSTGEFGPILSLVDKDTADGSIAWDHWEQGLLGLLAVYRYSVPAEKSHFAVFLPTEGIPGLSYEQHPAYHGEIAIDPTTGSVLRIAIEAESSATDANPSDPVPAALVVEYGSVEIGGKNYICPLHAIAMNRVVDQEGPKMPAAPRVFINDVTFTHYHLFRSEMRILP